MDAQRERQNVPEELAGERLDRALAQMVDGFSRTRLQEMIEDRRVLVDGEPACRASQVLEAGQLVEIELVERDRARAGSAPGVSFEVLYEDDSIVVLDKPAGMVAHPGTTVRGGTVSELLVERYGALPTEQGEDRPGIVHRLDADTSGVLVAARTSAAAQSLLAQFAAHTVKKRYLALVHGEPRFDSEWIELNLGRSADNRDRISVVPGGEGREAATFYEVVERMGQFALLACYPKTGRTHQIRVHLAHSEHPIIGDALYRGPRGTRRAKLPRGLRMGRQALHAQQLSFDHPESGERVTFTAEPPKDFARLAEGLRAAAAQS